MVTAFDRPVVTFASPPVVEVVAGVGLDEPDSTLGPAMSAFWQTQLRDEFPNLESQAPYIAPREQFGAPGEGAPGVQLEFGPAVPFPRLWASTGDQHELVQLHPRYFACNWRRVQPHDKYDNWSARRARFVEMYERFTAFVDDAAIPRPKVSQCEVTYINHIRSGHSWQSHAEWPRVFSVQIAESSPYPVESLTGELTFVIETPGGIPARLHCKVSPAFDAPFGQALYILELTVRGRPAGNGLAEVLAFMDSAREAIDKSFVSITTAEMHEEWGMRS